MDTSMPSRSMTWLRHLSIALALLLVPPAVLQAAEPARGSTPRVAGFGPVFPVEHAAVVPEAKTHYKVLVDITKEEPGYDKPNRGLELTARLANLLALAGVPTSHAHLAVVAHDHALDAMLNDAAYKAIHGTDNPNAAMLHALRQAGVELLVCGQTMAHRHLDASQLPPGVTVTLSAMTTVVLYQQRGYTVLSP